MHACFVELKKLGIEIYFLEEGSGKFQLSEDPSYQVSYVYVPDTAALLTSRQKK